MATKQSDIDGKPSFDEQSKRGVSLWNSKSGAIAGKNAFLEIKTKLIEMCVGVEICNFCENNEATDVEHIYPKSHFPERAFVWGNYLLACKICNTTYKSDKFKVFNPVSSDTVLEILRESGKPPTDDSLLIDPRVEEPRDFLILDIQGQTFRFVPKPGLDKRNTLRAEYTIGLLELNDRDALVEARRAAAKYFISRLEKYVKIKEAESFEEVEEILSDLDFLDASQHFADEQFRLLESIKKEISTYSHPTVWREFIDQRNILRRTNELLNRAPEALNW